MDILDYLKKEKRISKKDAEVLQKEALGKSIEEVILEKKILSEKELFQIKSKIAASVNPQNYLLVFFKFG